MGQTYLVISSSIALVLAPRAIWKRFARATASTRQLDKRTKWREKISYHKPISYLGLKELGFDRTKKYLAPEEVKIETVSIKRVARAIISFSISDQVISLKPTKRISQSQAVLNGPELGDYFIKKTYPD